MYSLRLETFIKVVDVGSFTKAAHALLVSPNAVIQQINQLEKDLGGMQLFIRTPRGVIPTQAGLSLYQDAKYIIQYSKDSLTRAKIVGRVQSV
mgnify:CR=1 FL=1